jgi:anti-anti-sigma regulatory factor
MLRIQRRANGEVVLTLYGRLEADNISELSDLLKAEATGRPLVLDLKEVVLVNQDVIRFLRACETDGVELRNCPAYIRAWIAQETEQA